ncbi:hypothetical protein Nmel_008506 [Mimus melanotis]
MNEGCVLIGNPFNFFIFSSCFSSTRWQHLCGIPLKMDKFHMDSRGSVPKWILTGCKSGSQLRYMSHSKHHM